ncbi:MAG: B12-binding domain-containing radical SAM protein, partial [Candidatus Omnitrophica bacterium]|nr:B12-binding domain-containing radical SAM protein [Candidatus Omnitrophota bacterium]
YLRQHAFDVVCIKVFATSVASVNHTIKLIRSTLPGVHIVIGGAQVNSDSENVLNYISADFALRGEAETGFPLLVKALADDGLTPELKRSIPGLVWKEPGGIMRNDPVIAKDLDALPYPAWDLMKPADFLPQDTRYARRYPVASIMLTRGCPYGCKFCSVSLTKFRKRSIDHTLAEIDMLRSEYGIREFNILDSNSAHDREHFIKFCKALAARNYNLPWRLVGGMRVDSLDAEMLAAMKESGCYQIWLGIESGSDRVLSLMNKELTVEQIKQKVRLVHKAGIDAGGYFVLGYPGEKVEEMHKTIRMALQLDLQYALFMIFVPEPGAPIFKEMQKTGRLGKIDYNDLDTRMFRNTFCECPPEKLVKIRDWATFRFYFRPRIIWIVLRDFASPEKLLLLLKVSFGYLVGRKFRW